MRDTILKVVEQIQSQKRESRQFPEHVMYQDVLRELRLMTDAELERLVEAGELRMVPTLNSHGYEVPNQKTENNELQSDLPEA